MSKTARTTIEGERFLHLDLWCVVRRQLEHGLAQPKGSFYDDLVAMVFALHTLEAYLNFAGERLAPDIWKDERNFFRNEPYRGFDGKLRKVLELVEMSEPSRNVRPYSTVWLLKDIRDLIAHAKPLKFGSVVDHSVDEEQQFTRSPLAELVSRANAERARDDIESFVEMIHAAARPKVSDVWFGPVALGGPLQYSSSHTTIAT